MVERLAEGWWWWWDLDGRGGSTAAPRWAWLCHWAGGVREKCLGAQGVPEEWMACLRFSRSSHPRTQEQQVDARHTGGDDGILRRIPSAQPLLPFTYEQPLPGQARSRSRSRPQYSRKRILPRSSCTVHSSLSTLIGALPLQSRRAKTASGIGGPATAKAKHASTEMRGSCLLHDGDHGVSDGNGGWKHGRWGMGDGRRETGRWSCVCVCARGVLCFPYVSCPGRSGECLTRPPHSIHPYSLGVFLCICPSSTVWYAASMYVYPLLLHRLCPAKK